MQDSDPHWTDRFYFNCHARDGRALLTCGYGVFPNQQQANGYAKQHADRRQPAIA